MSVSRRIVLVALVSVAFTGTNMLLSSRTIEHNSRDDDMKPRLLRILSAQVGAQEKLTNTTAMNGTLTSGISGTKGKMCYEVTTTDFGWSTSNESQFPRRKVTTEFWNAITSHSHYSPTAWKEVNADPQQNANRSLVIFLDVDSCLENFYPVYGVGQKWWYNADRENGRPSGGGVKKPLEESCQYIMQAAQAPALKANPRNRLVVLDCGGAGYNRALIHSLCKRRHPKDFKNLVLKNDQITIASYTQTNRKTRPGIDIGLSPPAVKPVELTNPQREAIATCQPRKYLFSFQGRKGFGRERLKVLAYQPDMHVQVVSQETYGKDLKSGQDNMGYKESLLNSTFGGVPRGDSLYSYRFSETMSAGVIPVVYADDWLRPFHPDVVDWSKCAVFIKEVDMAKTADILRSIPPQQVCKMQQEALRVWDQYVSSRTGWVEAMVESALAMNNSSKC